MRSELEAALAQPGERRRHAVSDVVRTDPRSLAAWAALGSLARDDVEAYACFRVGYHRGLDALRAAGWKGSGLVRWEHDSNRGFLRCLDGLRSASGAIGEHSRRGAVRPVPAPARAFLAGRMDGLPGLVTSVPARTRSANPLCCPARPVPARAGTPVLVGVALAILCVSLLSGCTLDQTGLPAGQISGWLTTSGAGAAIGQVEADSRNVDLAIAPQQRRRAANGVRPPDHRRPDGHRQPPDPGHPVDRSSSTRRTRMQPRRATTVTTGRRGTSPCSNGRRPSGRSSSPCCAPPSDASSPSPGTRRPRPPRHPPTAMMTPSGTDQ